MLYPANVNHLAKYIVPSNQQELALALSSDLKPVFEAMTSQPWKIFA